MKSSMGTRRLSPTACGVRRAACGAASCYDYMACAQWRGGVLRILMYGGDV